MNITIGADPELFVRKDGNPSSAFGLIPGTKKAPHVVDKGAVQVDGMALEFNIDPASDEDQFVVNITTVLNVLKNMVPEYTLDVSPSMHFPTEVMEAQPEEALKLGCDPDYNAYSYGTNDSPEAHPTMRVAGGHVHVGFTQDADITDENFLSDCRVLARQLDLFLGVPSVLLDDNVERREMYGKAGAFRPKTYGMEYRVLSNFWIRSPELTRWVFRNTRKAIHFLQTGNDLGQRWSSLIQPTINVSDKNTASMLVNAAYEEHGINLLEGLE